MRECREREGGKKRSSGGDAAAGKAEAASSNKRRARLEASSAGRGAVGSTVMPTTPCHRSEVAPAPSVDSREVPRDAVMNAAEVGDRWFNSVLIKGANDEC